MKKLIGLMVLAFVIYLSGGVLAGYETPNGASANSNVNYTPPTSGSDGSEFCGLFEVECLNAYTIYNEVTAEVTAYSEIDSCHYANCVMANGERAHVGAVACPREIKLGTQVEINGVMYTCKDRTAKYLNGRYDIFMGYGQESYDKAISYGVQKQIVRLYE